jgi:hypothetical protein
MKKQETVIKESVAKFQAVMSEQISPIESVIAKNLAKMHASMSEDEAFDWTCDLVSCENEDEVSETLDRIRKLQG